MVDRDGGGQVDSSAARPRHRYRRQDRPIDCRSIVKETAVIFAKNKNSYQ